MTELIPFTSNFSDMSTNEGYQFEFRCQRCGNGFRSRFRPSVTGFGGRLAALGGSILGGEIGNRVQEIGYIAQWDRSGTRGVTNDKRLLEASEDVAGEFRQCRGCTDWVCRHQCWDQRADVCTTCAPAQHGPPQGADPYGRPGHGTHGQAPGYGAPVGGGRTCTSCGAVGPGRFCGHCGTPFAPPSCRGCGAPSQGTRFCGHCGTPA